MKIKMPEKVVDSDIVIPMYFNINDPSKLVHFTTSGPWLGFGQCVLQNYGRFPTRCHELNEALLTFFAFSSPSR